MLYSNNIIIAKIIVLFFDFYDNNKVNSNKISFKLLKFEQLIGDLYLNNLKKDLQKLVSNI